MSKQVLITRDIESTAPLSRNLSQLGMELRGVPMIETVPVPFNTELPRVSWIFFSSKQAVETFFGQSPRLGKVKLAAIGQGTAKALKSYGEVVFNGGDADTDEVARMFKKAAGRSKVLFPVSDRSVRTVQSALKEDQVIEVVCYSTLEKPEPVGHPDIVVFSSPSNVEAYLKVNKLMPHQVCVAFGKSTARALEEHGVTRVVVSRGTSDNALTDAIIAASGS